jgi:precorrin-6Y C5,15-methyltransferase (decarboxylating)
MKIRPKDIIWDIGAGSGALSIEAAERAWKGKVFSFEKDPGCIEFIRQNKERFSAQNLEIIPGTAPEILKDQPLPQTVFIGGSGGNLLQILDHLAEHLPRPWNLVMTFAILENLTAATYWCNSRKLVPEILQADLKYAAKIESGMRLVPQNPIFILSLSFEA